MSKAERNPFVALCDVASKKNWCWSIFCTTCGHGLFRVSFSKLIHGLHPDTKSFWSYGQQNHSPLNEFEVFDDFRRGATLENQIKLATIVADSKLNDIHEVSKFPDWLGYIGLVIRHCSSYESKKIVSDSFLPQFVSMLSGDKNLSGFLKEKQTMGGLLSLEDLKKMEFNKLFL